MKKRITSLEDIKPRYYHLLLGKRFDLIYIALNRNILTRLSPYLYVFGIFLLFLFPLYFLFFEEAKLIFRIFEMSFTYMVLIFFVYCVQNFFHVIGMRYKKITAKRKRNQKQKLDKELEKIFRNIPKEEYATLLDECIDERIKETLSGFMKVPIFCLNLFYIQEAGLTKFLSKNTREKIKSHYERLTAHFNDERKMKTLQIFTKKEFPV